MDTPVNQFILNSSSIYPYEDLDTQISNLEVLRKKLQLLKYFQLPNTVLWNEIDSEVQKMTDEQKALLLNDLEYFDVYTQLQEIVLRELLNMVKSKIENSPEGKELLESQLKIVKKLKKKIIEDTNREMEIFRKFKDFSKTNPGITYEEFIKSNI